MIRIITTLLLFLSLHVSATQCIDGKKTIEEWSKDDGTYSDYNLPTAVINGHACLLKPLDGETLQSTREILNLINQNMTTDHKRKIPFNQLPKLLATIGDKYNVYLVKPCESTPTPSPACEHSDSVILGYVAESQVHFGEKSYVQFRMSQFIESSVE